MLTTNQIIVIIAFVTLMIMMPSLFVMSKKNASKMGDCLFSFPKKPSLTAIASCVLSVVLLGVLLFRNFGYLTLILAGCCILAPYMMAKDSFSCKYYGVYEKGMIVPGFTVFYDDILAFPVFELPPEEQEHYPKEELVIVTNTKGKFSVRFASEEECNKVIENLKTLQVIK
ncbi:MAG: hypothetical protein MJ162_02540 [Treponema sp.]|nr:hypothetical protein [Treponema sp.]